MRPIDANALRNKAYQAMLEIADTPLPNDYASKLAVKMGEVFQKLIDEAPTIDAEPVRHGRWEHLGGDVCYFVGYCAAVICDRAYFHDTPADCRILHIHSSCTVSPIALIKVVIWAFQDSLHLPITNPRKNSPSSISWYSNSLILPPLHSSSRRTLNSAFFQVSPNFLRCG